MKFLKKLNLLDYLIFIGVFLTVFAAIYNFLPQSGTECKIVISYEGEAKIKDGDICFDIKGNKKLGEITVLNEGFSVLVDGGKEEYGIKFKERIYAKKLPLEMFVGDYYLIGRVEEIYYGLDEN